MSTIGSGYIWPNIECVSDGERVFLQAHPTSSRSAEPLRYIADAGEVMTGADLEYGCECFIDQVVEKLRAESVLGSNLERIWSYTREERRDPDSAWYRRIEAAMGFEPDEADEQLVETLIGDAALLGRNAVAELAASASRDEPAQGSEGLKELALSLGHDADLSSIPSLTSESSVTPADSVPAWVVGESAARALRRNEKLSEGPVSDTLLASLAGTSPDALRGKQAPLSYFLALDGGGTMARLILQSPFKEGRRFALARLLGDRVVGGSDEALTPALRSRTYRQKLQRAFAAEFLCPFDEARQQLGHDLSDENQQRVASEYDVSPMLVRTQLVNNGQLGRDTLELF
jgi:hypothetical protein